MDASFVLDTIRKSFIGGKGTIYPNEFETIRSELEHQAIVIQKLKDEICAMHIELEYIVYEKFDSGMYYALRGKLRELSEHFGR